MSVAVSSRAVTNSRVTTGNGTPKNGVQDEITALLGKLSQMIQQNAAQSLPKQQTPAGKPNVVSHLAANPRTNLGTTGTQQTPSRGAPNTAGAHAVATNNGKKGPSGVNTAHFGALQLPTGSPGRPDTISGGKLENFQNSSFKRNGDGSITLSVPKGGGVTTPNSSFPRSELAENKTWNMSNGPHSLSATLSVDKLPPNGNVVIGQIHQKRSDGKPPRPPMEIHFQNGQVYATVMSKNAERGQYTRKKIVLAENIKPGEKFSYDATMNKNGKIDLTVNGKTKSVALDPSFNGTNFYFKAGNYCQDKNGGSQVTFNKLGIQH
jgi:hypothetical protein